MTRPNERLLIFSASPIRSGMPLSMAKIPAQKEIPRETRSIVMVILSEEDQ